MEKLLKKFKIKNKPDKVLTVTFYIISGILVLISLVTIFKIIFTDIRLPEIFSPYIYSLFLLMPVLAYAFFPNSGYAKNDSIKIKTYIISCAMLGVIVGGMACTWLNNGIWWIIERLPNYSKVYSMYPELFAPAIKSLCLAIPFVAVFRFIDYFLKLLRDEDLPRAIAAFSGISATKKSTNKGPFTCETVICKAADTSLPVIVPEKKRYEATLVQGATGTGKTATVLLPMSSFDLEKKFFFREYSKKLGYSMLKKGIAYMEGPFNNEYINRNFSLNYLKPRRGMEEEFMSHVENIVQYVDNATNKITYKNLGITILENDGNFISQFIGVAKNFDLDVYSIDPGAPETTLSINPFAIPDPAKVASIVGDVLNAMYESTGGGSKGSDPFFTQVTTDAFQNLSILLKEMHPILHNGEVASLEDMLELLYNFDRVEEMTEEMKKIPELERKYKLLIAYFEKNFYKPALNINGFEIPGTRGSGRKDTEKFLYGAITQINNLIRHPGLKAALCGKKNIVDFDKILEEGSIVTACSRKGELGILQAKAFGMFFILQFQDAVLRRKGNEDSRTPHFLYIDEFPEYITKDMEVMFTLFRKYRCGVTVAIQNLSQLEKSGKSYYRQVVLANTKTQIVFGDTVPEDSEYWEKSFGKDKVPDQSTEYKVNKDGTIESNVKIKKEKKFRAEWFKIANLGFGAIFYKTKDASGKTIFGKGKTSFLDSKYKEKSDTAMFNFEKYMMTKPEDPVIQMNENNNNSDGDTYTSNNSYDPKMVAEINKLIDFETEELTKNETIYANTPNTITPDISIDDDIEIIFDEPSIENPINDGGIISENHETPIITKKDS